MKVEQILSDLIEIKTFNKSISNKACIDYICEILKQNNVLHKRIMNPDGLNENIIAGINIHSFKNIDTGLIFSGHIDTVDVNLKDWDSNPFQAVNINNTIYGRGAVDMKYFIAEVLSLISEFQKSDIPIFFLFSCDEETDVQGIRTLTRFLKMRNIRPKYALVGEPTHFDICLTNKGYVGYTTTIKGISAHSSCPELGVNAAYIAAKIIAKIEDLCSLYTKQGTTLNVGVIHGGEGRNSIPSEVRIDWEIRYFKENHKNEILQAMCVLQKELSNEYRNSYICLDTKENLPCFEQKSNTLLVNIAQNILKTNIYSMPHATEAGFLKRLGIDTIICGAGDEKLAHSSSECIKVDDLYKYRDFLTQFVREIQKVSKKQ